MNVIRKIVCFFVFLRELFVMFYMAWKLTRAYEQTTKELGAALIPSLKAWADSIEMDNIA